MSQPRFEVADMIRSAGADFIARNRRWLRWTHLNSPWCKDLISCKRGGAAGCAILRWMWQAE